MRELYKLLIVVVLLIFISFTAGYLFEKQEVHTAYMQGLSNGIPFAWGVVNAATRGDVAPADVAVTNETMYKLGQRYYSANRTERDEIFKVISSGY